MAKTQSTERNFLTDTARLSMANYKQMVKKRFLNRTTKLRPLHVCGHMGIGKTQAIYQAAEELTKELKENVEVMCVSMHCMEAPDWNGLSYVLEGKTFFAQPHLLPTEGFGILFLDEFNRAPKDLHQAALTLIENREINGHKLGDNWMIATAGNLGQDQTEVLYQVRDLDPALKDRLAHYNLMPTITEVISYLGGKYGKDNKVVRWITAENNAISFDGKGKTSPRSLEYLIRALLVHSDMDVFTIASGEIGNSAAIQFQQYLTSPASLSLKDLLDMTPETREVIMKFNADKREALKTGKMSDFPIMNQWIELIYGHLKELKDKDDASSRKFSTANYPKECAAVAELMWMFDAYEWLTTLVSRIGSLYLMKEDVENLIYKPILDSKPGLKDKLKKVYSESSARDAAEKKVLEEQVKLKQASDKKALAAKGK